MPIIRVLMLYINVSNVLKKWEIRIRSDDELKLYIFPLGTQNFFHLLLAYG
jgi:hypothetical protein